MRWVQYSSHFCLLIWFLIYIYRHKNGVTYTCMHADPCRHGGECHDRSHGCSCKSARWDGLPRRIFCVEPSRNRVSSRFWTAVFQEAPVDRQGRKGSDSWQCQSIELNGKFPKIPGHSLLAPIEGPYIYISYKYNFIMYNNE